MRSTSSRTVIPAISRPAIGSSQTTLVVRYAATRFSLRLKKYFFSVGNRPSNRLSNAYAIFCFLLFHRRPGVGTDCVGGRERWCAGDASSGLLLLQSHQYTGYRAMDCWADH